jgi:hypothetical protein
LDPELCSHQNTWLNIRNLVGSHRACAFRMCVANVLVKEGYRPCLLTNFSKQGRYPSFTRTLATHIRKAQVR